jgi:hypothetical protein
MQKKKKTIGELNPSGGVIDGIFLGSSEMKWEARRRVNVLPWQPSLLWLRTWKFPELDDQRLYSAF